MTLHIVESNPATSRIAGPLQELFFPKSRKCAGAPGALSDDTLPADNLMLQYARRELISSFKRGLSMSE